MSTSDPRLSPLHVFYASHHSWLLHMLQRRVRNHCEAEDLTSETFVQVVASRIDPAGVHEPRAFLTTIAKRLLFHFRRRQALERDYLERLALLPEALAPSPEERALLIEAVAAIDRVLHGLPLKVRTAFLFNQLEGMPHDEIAARLDVSTRTVARYITQALEHCMLATLE